MPPISQMAYALYFITITTSVTPGFYRMRDQERYEQTREDPQNLKALGVDIASITCDGHKGLLKAIRKVYPDMRIQRCLVHVKRQSQTWLTRYPKTAAGQELLQLSRRITSLKTYEQGNQWLIDIYHRHQKHKHYIDEKSADISTGGYWYRHKMLHQTATLIIKAIPDMFHYLDDPQMPYTTNRLESFFGHLKEKPEIHRGLRPAQPSVTLSNGIFILRIMPNEFS